MNNNEKIAVIVPVYNVRQYINKCIGSICKQTYSNLEIILVDDGSTDGSSEICDNFCSKDKRIQVIHKKNGGLSSARNEGIRKVTSKYVTFIDGDDFISDNYIEVLYTILINTNADISCCGLLAFHDISDIGKKHKKCTIITRNTCEALEKMMYQKEIQNNACAKLYKTQLFNKISFPNGKLCEDLATVYKLISKSSRVSFTNNKLYYYLQRQNSIIHSQFDERRMDGLYFAKMQNQYIAKKYPKIIKASVNRLFMESMYILRKVPLEDKYKKYIKEIERVIRRYRLVVLFDKKSTIKSKIHALISFAGVRFVKVIFK